MSNKKIKTFKEMQSILGAVWPIRSKLYRLCIEVNDYSEVIINVPDYVQDELNKLCFFERLNFEQRITLALACAQEDRNNYLDQSEIDFINKFFDIKITGEKINKLGNQYI